MPHSETFTDSPNHLENTGGFMKTFRKLCGCGIYGDVVNSDFTAGRFRIICGSGKGRLREKVSRFVRSSVLFSYLKGVLKYNAFVLFGIVKYLINW